MKIDLKNFGKRTILIIEDDEDILTNIRTVFEMEDYMVFSARNGQEGMELLHSFTDKNLPDLIFLDYHMPIANGEVFNNERLKFERFRDIPLVVMTAMGRITDIIPKIEAYAYIEKPMSVDKIIGIAFNYIHRNEMSRCAYLT